MLYQQILRYIDKTLVLNNPSISGHGVEDGLLVVEEGVRPVKLDDGALHSCGSGSGFLWRTDSYAYN